MTFTLVSRKMKRLEFFVDPAGMGCKCTPMRPGPFRPLPLSPVRVRQTYAIKLRKLVAPVANAWKFAVLLNKLSRIPTYDLP